MMREKESKAIHISLVTAFFVIILITSTEIMGEALRIFIPSFTPWLQKVLLVILLPMASRVIIKDHNKLRQYEFYKKIQKIVAPKSKVR